MVHQLIVVHCAGKKQQQKCNKEDVSAMSEEEEESKTRERARERENGKETLIRRNQKKRRMTHM